MSREPRRLLILAAAFPPHPSPAAHRARFIARHAPEFGWDVRVLSVRPEYFAEQPDFELEQALAAGLDVRRVRALPYSAARRLGFGDLSLRSLPFMRHALREECKAWRPSVLFASAPPYFSFVLAREAKKAFGIPYVLDYTDPWIFPLPAEQQSLTKRAYWMDRIARFLEPGIVRDAAHLLAVSDATHDGVRRRNPAIPLERFSSLPIGFDTQDFDALRRQGRRHALWNAADGDIHVLHPGAISPTGYETVRALLGAAKALRDRDALRGRSLRLHFIGTSYAPGNAAPIVAPIAEALGVGDLVHEHPARVPYIEALNAISHADIVLTLGSTDPHYTASKVYNCIASGRPMLVICHEETLSVRAAVETTGAGEVVTYNDIARAESKVTEIADALARLSLPGTHGATATAICHVESFSARVMTGKVVALLEAARVARSRETGA